ncbi:hypothetical protein SFRURICE_015755 [Spodoptera frugiperda]|nr:hypothetical protein SFRURICE_015755 [Spodoptera frugiperda]
MEVMRAMDAYYGCVLWMHAMAGFPTIDTLHTRATLAILFIYLFIYFITKKTVNGGLNALRHSLTVNHRVVQRNEAD